jgi:hypothetical protein
VLALLGTLWAGNGPPALADQFRPRGDSPHAFRVLTQNVYQGADLTPLILAPSPQNVELVFGSVVQTNFPERAAWLADEIEEMQPLLIGLQEVSLWRSQTPGDFLTGNFTPNAQHVEFDYLEIRLDELHCRGLEYVAVVISPSLDAELPGIGRDVRLTDRDVILARSDLPRGQFRLRNAQAGVFAAFTPIPLPFGVLPFRRSWAAVDVQYRGSEFRFIATHLDNLSAVVQEAQAAELLAGPAETDLPTLLVGDLNSAAEGPGYDTATYPNLLDAGFIDAWTEADPDEPGFTIGQNALLDNKVSQLDARIDFVLFRDAPPRRRHPDQERFHVRGARRISADPHPITPTVHWISDHAGVAAALMLKPGRR